MRLYRTYHPSKLSIELPYKLELSADSFNHLCKVLRLKDGEIIHVVDNSGGYYVGSLIEVSKKTAFVNLEEYIKTDNESNIGIHLIQAISRGEKMDLTIQKAVELGVTNITPIFTERCGVNLSDDRLEKKIEHWQNIAISACLQSYRNIIPVVNTPLKFNEFIKQLEILEDEVYINLHPFSGNRLKDLDNKYKKFNLIIGPEGGLSDQEIDLLNEKGFTNVNLGPRVLRTETAGLATISILQAIFGDL